MTLRSLLSVVGGICVAATAPAQTTWIVYAGGGPGVHFLDLPSAVAAAADGDTIIVRAGPFNEGAAPFVTSKGLTIVGEGGQVPITSSTTNPFVVTDLPPTSTFRMVGFQGYMHFFNLSFDVTNCAGKVHLERLISDNHASPLPPFSPAFRIFNSANVTLRDIANYGAPAVQIDSSNVALVGCQLGFSVGGQALRANYSTVDIVEPRFDPVYAVPNGTIELLYCTTRMTGSSAALVKNYSSSPVGQPVVKCHGGTLQYDPGLPIVNTPSGPAFLGTTVRTAIAVPASFTAAAMPGQSLGITTIAPAGAAVVPALGTPGFMQATPLGTLGIDIGAAYSLLAPMVVPASGIVTVTLTVPAGLPRGQAYATQSVVVTASDLQIGLPCTFVLH